MGKININIKNNFFIYIAVISIWVVTLLIKLKYNGLVFGFDYGLYHPDGTLYTTRTSDWSGYSETEAARIVSDWYNVHAYKFNQTSPSDFYYAVNPFYREYSTRILYPLLSIPFVKFFGVPGMLAVPAISLLVVIVVVARIGIILGKPFVSFLTIIMLSSSSTFTRWMVVNTTDALLTGMFSIAAYCLVKKIVNFRWYLIFGVLVFLTSTTRISILFWIGIASVLIFQKNRKKACFIVLFSALVVVPTFLSNSSNSFLAVEAEKSLWQRFLLYPFYFIKITFYEFAQLFVLDRILFFLCALSIYFSLKYIHKDSSKYLLLILFAGLLTGAMNGTVGVNFRYQLPVIAFICWSIIDNTNISLNGFLKRSR
jgi:hypothetical protein